MRRGRSIALLALLLAGFGLAAGCRSLTTQPPPFLEDGGVFVLEDPLPGDVLQLARAHAAYATGIHHEVVEEPAAAETAYRAALAADPGNATYALRVACVLAQQEKIGEALEFAETFAAAHPGSAEIELWLAAIYGKTGEWDAALRHARAATELDPGEAKGWLAWAGVLQQTSPDDPAAVREVLERGIEAATDAVPLRRQMLQELFTDFSKFGEDSADPKAAEIGLAMLEQAREIDRASPGDPDTLRLLAALLFQAGLPEEGLKTLARYMNVAENEDEDATVASLALQMIPARELENAVEAVSAMRERGEAPPDGWFLQARCLERLGRTEEAIDAARQATRESPNDVDLWLWLVSLVDRNDTPAVYRTVKDALRANPGSARLHGAMAVTAFQLHRFALAERECLLALELQDKDPDYTGTVSLQPILAAIQTKNGRHDEAARALLAAVAENGNPGIVEDFAMDIFFSSSLNFRLAAKTLHAFVDIAPTAGLADAARAALAFAYMSHGQPKNAVKEFDAIVAHYPDMLSVPARLQLMRAVALESAGRTGDAREALEHLVRTHPNFVEPYNSLAYTLAEAGTDLDRALELAEFAVARDPSNAAYLDTLAWVQYGLGRYEEAWENIRLAVSYAPGEEVINGHAKAIADALEAARRKEENAGGGDSSGDEPADPAPGGAPEEP